VTSVANGCARIRPCASATSSILKSPGMNMG
jgi:hypothetical protein